jgi:hypothetical protein
MLVSNQVIEIAEAIYVSNYTIRLKFDDGSVREIDFGNFLMQARNPMITKYRDLEEFKKFYLEYGDLVWNNYELCFPIIMLYEGKI